jgi:anti-anti-sigma factor
MQHDQLIRQVQARAQLGSRGAAEAGTRATLETLGERIPEGLVDNVASQLPLEVGKDPQRTITMGETGNRRAIRPPDTAPSLRETLVKVLGSHPCPHVIADLTDVVFIDSVGLGLLVAANLRAEERGVLFTLVPSSDCRRLLRLTCLDTDFRMASTLNNAIVGTREQTEPRAPRNWPGR